jgi:transcriptional regulator with XRE-family HTH domain
MKKDARDIAFGKRLKELMEAREFTQSSLAREIWGTRITDEGKEVARGRERISLWISGHDSPNFFDLERLVEALGIKISDFDS